MDATADQAHAVPMAEKGGALEVLGVSTRLGLTSFGGPIAHLGYFHAEYVARRRWLTEQTYADLVALCQFLPGPTSIQVGIAIGMMWAGLLGGIAAWLGFTGQEYFPAIRTLLHQREGWTLSEEKGHESTTSVKGDGIRDPVAQAFRRDHGTQGITRARHMTNGGNTCTSSSTAS